MKLCERREIGELGRVLVGVLLLVMWAGCGGARPRRAALEPEPVPEVRLSGGDVVEIRFFYVPELNETQTVRPDGKISLQLVGEVDVGGRTPAEVREELVERYSGPLGEKAEVAVVVRSLWSRRVYVGGEVNRPGLIEMGGRLTALEAIMQADGFNLRTGRVGNVVIIRRKDGEQYGMLLDLRGALSGKRVEPFYLEPLDIVYVPRTRIANVNQWVDQHINMLLPVGLVYTRPLGEGTIGISPPR